MEGKQLLLSDKEGGVQSFLVSRDGGTCNRRQSLSVAVAEDKREVTDATSFCFSGERGSALSPPRTIVCETEFKLKKKIKKLAMSVR